MKVETYRNAFATILFAVILSGCGAGGTRGVEETHEPIRVNHLTVAHAIQVDPATNRPPLSALSEMREFLASRHVGYGDRLTVSGGTEAARADLIRHLSGLGHYAVQDGGDGDRGMILTVDRTVLTPPACGDWSHSPEADHSNLPVRNYGCATQSNLARMLADPNDLIEGRSPGRAVNSQYDVLTIEAHRVHGITVSESSADTVTTGE